MDLVYIHSFFSQVLTLGIQMQHTLESNQFCFWIEGSGSAHSIVELLADVQERKMREEGIKRDLCYC